MTIKGVLLLALLSVAAVGSVEAAFAPLPCNARKVIYFGWDTLGATTEDVYVNRDKFAEAGFDGIAMQVDGVDPNGQRIVGRKVISSRQWSYDDFAATLPKLKEMTKLKGLKESVAMVYWMSKPRLKWDDDAAWERFAENMRVVCRVAKEGGLKGCFIDHEDYTGKPLFIWRRGEDPALDETLALARKRGAQVFKAMYEAFPEGKMIVDRGILQHEPEVNSHTIPEAVRQRGGLWLAFMNGGLEVLPDGSRFCDGNEASYGEITADDYRARYFACCREALELVEPQLRRKYQDSLEMCFAKYLNAHLPPKSTPAKFTESLFGAGYLTDELYWVYGERFSVIDWGRELSKRTTNVVWGTKFPDFAQQLRVSVGDYSGLRTRAAAGELANLVSNSDCDAKARQRTPAPFGEHNESKKADAAACFAYDASDGCSKPGCLMKIGNGSYTLGCDGCVRPGERFYVTIAAKADNPCINVVWRSEKKPAKWHWHAGYQILVRPSADLGNGWKRYEVCALAPEGVDGIGLVFGGFATPESPVKFDDIAIYRW